MKDKIHFAVLGYGSIGKRYANIIARLPQTVLTALIDSQGKADNEQGVPFYDSLEFFLADNIPCDIVIIATPNGLHAEHAKQCLNAGKHVLVEKPVAFKQSEAEELMAIASQKGLMLFPVWQIRYSPYISALYELLNSGSLGKVFWVQADCFWNRGEQYYHQHPWHGTLKLDGGPLYTQFSHVIDLLQWLCGKLEIHDASFYKIRASLPTEFEDSGVLNLKLKDEGVASLSYTISAPAGTSSNEMTIITEKAKIKLSGKYFDVLDFIQCSDSSISAKMEMSSSLEISDIAEYCSMSMLNSVRSMLVDERYDVDRSSVSAATVIVEKAYESRGRFM